MAIDDPRPGAVHYIDHYAVPTNDLLGWHQFMTNALGGTYYYTHGLTTKDESRGAPVRSFFWVGPHEIGGFLQKRTLPEPAPLGTSAPRFGFWVRPEDMDGHLRRLDRLGVPTTGPLRTSEEGEDGTALYFSDPDGNPYELWAPRQMPEHAMEGDNPVGLGRISHSVLESTDLDRTIDFYGRFCGVEPIENDDIPSDTVAFRLAGGGRMVFKKVDAIGPRSAGNPEGKWDGQHVSLTLRHDEWDMVHKRLWDGLPIELLMQHPKVLRGERPPEFEAGGYFMDNDGNTYHYNRWHSVRQDHGEDAETYGKNPFGVNPH